MDAEQREALFRNTAAALGGALDFIKLRHVENCMRCDPAYCAGVARALGLSAELPAAHG
jgi:catalase